jgi:hypothetical protein
VINVVARAGVEIVGSLPAVHLEQKMNIALNDNVIFSRASGALILPCPANSIQTVVHPRPYRICP